MLEGSRRVLRMGDESFWLVYSGGPPAAFSKTASDPITFGDNLRSPQTPKRLTYSQFDPILSINLHHIGISITVICRHISLSIRLCIYRSPSPSHSIVVLIVYVFCCIPSRCCCRLCQLVSYPTFCATLG